MVRSGGRGRQEPSPCLRPRWIHNRLNEIVFNATLIKELRAAALLRRMADPGSGEGAVWAGMRVHRIASDVMLDLGYSSKLLAEWEFFCMLRDEGRAAAAAFLDEHGKDLGVRSTLYQSRNGQACRPGCGQKLYCTEPVAAKRFSRVIENAISLTRAVWWHRRQSPGSSSFKGAAVTGS